MTALTTDLGRPWLSSVPDGASVLARDVTEYAVAAVATEHFSARRLGQASRQWFPVSRVADGERALLKAGARFWLVTERVVSPGVATAEAAFARESGGAR